MYVIRSRVRTITLCMSRFSFPNVLLASILLRVTLILYSEWHDARSLVKYTDVDYRVFSDAARFLVYPSDDNRAKGFLNHIIHLGE